MKKIYFLLYIIFCYAFTGLSQSPVVKVDLNMSGRSELECNDPNYVPWIPDNAPSISKTVSGVTFTFKKAGNNGSALRATYYKAGVQAPYYARLGCDGMLVDGGNAGAQIELTISGLATGTHSFMAFHNAIDDPGSFTFSPVDVLVNGTTTISGLVMSKRAVTTDALQSSYVTFNATAGKNVVILYKAQTSGSASMKNVYINGFELNTPNVKNQSKNPIPTDGDLHVDADSKTATLKWTAGASAVSHRIYFSTDKSCVTSGTTTSACYMGQQTATSYNIGSLYSMNTYYWRVDEVTSSGVVTKGNVWVFSPRQLAFPGAEGYGRYAKGGRGGKVVHVTNLNDSGTGSLRDAVENQIGPRTIVFDIAGIIVLKSRLVLSDANVTIAGQTAPGNGICLRTAPFGFTGNDVIARHIRLRLGAGPTYDGMGMTGANHTIMDHCSISWTIDESFSSRSGKNITLQRTLISEALNAAGHQNYPAGTEHGYAATIGGDVGSFHHNLLAHNYGRNWSMGGGLDGNNYYAGRLDITNNVVYNWGGRTTDGGAMEVNFVGNYYKPGAGSKIFNALSIQHEGTGLGTQRAYFSGNVMPGYFNESNQTAGRTESFSNGDYKKYEAFVNAAFFPSYVTTQKAYDAYKSVLSDVGASQPFFDIHDNRMITETLNGTYTVKGSVTGKPGFPDKEADAGGYESYPTVSRASSWDSDGDGMPNFWETAHGTNPNSGAGNFTESNEDPDQNGYTRLEDYLNWMAEPHYLLTNGSTQTINITNLFKGYSKTSPVYTSGSVTNGTVAISGSTATFTKVNCGMASFKLTVKDADGATMTRTIGMYVEGNCGNPPVVNLTAPLTNTSVCKGTTLALVATATTTTGTINKVDFYNGTTLLGTDNSAPYNFNYTASTATTLSLHAIATTSLGITGTSSTNTITVKALPTATISSSAGTVVPYGGTIILNASTGTGYTYQWKNGTTNISAATASTYAAAGAGSYSVVITSNGCSTNSAAFVLTADAPPKKYIYNYDNSGNLAWSNTNSWTPKSIPRAIDTVVVRSGEVQINDITHIAPVYIETNGTLRLVSASSSMDKIHMQGGTLKVYTSSPEFALTSNIIVEKPSTIMAGSVAATIFTLNGTITGSGDLTKTSVGNLRINSSATGFKGNWIVTEGKLQIRSATGLGVCGVQVQGSARLDIEAPGASIYSLVIASTAGVDLDQNLNVTVAVFGPENILSGAYKNANYPSYIGGANTLSISNSIVATSGPSSFCAGTSLALTSSSGASYIWKNNTTEVGTTASYTTAIAGNYTVNVVSAAGCKVSSAPVVTTLHALPIITQNVKVDAGTWVAASSATACETGTVSFGPWPTQNNGWSWTGPNNFTSSVRDPIITNLNSVHTGNYIATYIDGNGCKATSTFALIVSKPTATITTPATSICSGGSTLLTASAGTSYKWFNGTTQVGTESTYKASSAGNYTVEVSNASGCKASSAVTQITVSTLPVATITSPTTSICSGSSVVLTASAGNSYKWYNVTTQVGSASTYTAETSGAYTVEVSNASGCKATSAVTQITVSTVPTATITSPTTSICSGGSVVLTASAGASYKWFNGTTQVGTESTYKASTAGNYSVEVSNASGCKSTSAVSQISVSTLPVATITTPITSFCSGESTVLTASAGASYKWYNSGTLVGTNQTNVANTAGNYVVEVTYKGGCKATSAVTQITVSTVPTATITSPTTSICSGSSVVLTASAGNSYKWYNGTTQVGSASTYTAETSGAYSVEVSNASGCKSTSAVSQISVSTLPAATITSPSTSFCSGGSTVLTASTGASYKWYNSGTFVGTNQTYVANTAGNYVVEVTNGSGCKTLSAGKEINITTGIVWYQDIDGDGKGDALVSKTSCNQPFGYVSIAGDACPSDAYKIDAGNCGCGKTENSCLDCAGVPNGTAVYDNCNVCVGGTTSNTACVATATMNGTTTNITVIPQPFDNLTTIKLENLGMIQNVKVFTASGALVETFSNLYVEEITLGDNLAAGLYSVIIQSENGVYTTKIVKR